jgi:riboflavin kinase/FMN adenylyltransferase
LSVAVIKGLDNYSAPEGRSVVATIGTFDGIHRGHQKILERVMNIAGDLNAEPLVITFDPHPRVLVTPEDAPLLLTTLPEKERYLKQYFRGTVLVLQFNAALKNLSAADFVREILVDQLDLKHLVVGADHAFGKDRSGNIDELRRLGAQFGFQVEVVEPVLLDSERISSTKVRRRLEAGDFEQALKYLGHHYAIHGIVEKGIGLGRKLGYPTANIKYGGRKLLPAQGVYACRALVGEFTKDGMMFIGRNHFNPEAKITVEANLFDFDQDIYDEEMIVYPIRFVRPNRKFETTEALVERINIDKQEVLKIIEKEKQNVSD